jgi:hypothetical protein
MRSRTLLLLVAGALTLTACNSFDEDQPLSEQTDDDDRDDAVESVVDGSGGVIATSEAECWVDAIIESGATPAEVEAFGADPLSIDSADIADALVGCIDPTIEMDVPFEGDVREQLVAGFTGGGVDREVAECILDELASSGVDARALTIAGWNDDAAVEIDAFVIDAIGACQLDLG